MSMAMTTVLPLPVAICSPGDAMAEGCRRRGGSMRLARANSSPVISPRISSKSGVSPARRRLRFSSDNSNRWKPVRDVRPVSLSSRR